MPVGAFVTGLTQTDDGALWASGPEGLARLAAKAGWGRYLGDATLTATATDPAGNVSSTTRLAVALNSAPAAPAVASGLAPTGDSTRLINLLA